MRKLKGPANLLLKPPKGSEVSQMLTLRVQMECQITLRTIERSQEGTLHGQIDLICLALRKKQDIRECLPNDMPSINMCPVAIVAVYTLSVTGASIAESHS